MSKVILTTGGTGGHIYPAMSVADELKKRNIDVLFVGTDNRMEKEIVPEAGYRFIGLHIKPPRSIINILKYMIGMIRGFFIVLREKPDAIIGFGNYISVPVVFSGILLRKKVYLQEQNAIMGGTNKFFYRFVKKTFLAFDVTFEDSPIKYQKKLMITGNPLRKEIEDIDIKEEKEKLKIEKKEKVLVITGGSLGAKSINDAVLDKWDKIFENKALRVYWSTGEENFEEISKKLDKIKMTDTVKPYFNNLINIMAAADLIICRAGALTISEIIALGKPSILIPYSSKKVGQASNAAILKRNGSGLVYTNKEADIAIDKALELMNDKDELKKMTIKIRDLQTGNAAEKIVDNIDIWRKQ